MLTFAAASCSGGRASSSLVGYMLTLAAASCSDGTASASSVGYMLTLSLEGYVIVTAWLLYATRAAWLLHATRVHDKIAALSLGAAAALAVLLARRRQLRAAV